MILPIVWICLHLYCLHYICIFFCAFYQLLSFSHISFHVIHYVYYLYIFFPFCWSLGQQASSNIDWLRLWAGDTKLKLEAFVWKIFVCFQLVVSLFDFFSLVLCLPFLFFYFLLAILSCWIGLIFLDVDFLLLCLIFKTG